MGVGLRVRNAPVRGASIAAGLIALIAGTRGYAAPPSKNPCPPATTETATVAAVVDGRTLRLASGDEVRLAGLETSDSFAGGVAAAASAKTALAAIAGGKTLDVHALGQDRYGRVLAYVFAAENRSRSLQQRLLSAGSAVVAARVSPPRCAPLLLSAERAARAARLGLWADPQYVIRRADRPAEVARARGRFALVQGKVLSVNDRGATIYVNFGRRWSQDFTVTIAKRNSRSFAAAGLEPPSLAGRRVLVRGWVDERGGPWIEASRPEQIEFADRN